MITKQELMQLMSNFKKKAKEQEFLLMPTLIMTESTIEDAYYLIGRNSSDCKYDYDGISYREDLYDTFVSFGLSYDDAYDLLEKVRKEMAKNKF